MAFTLRTSEARFSSPAASSRSCSYCGARTSLRSARARRPGYRRRVAHRVPTLGAIARAWGRIGIVGFGGPPAHIALLRELVVDRRRWMRPEQFEDGLAAVNLLPGPASTQLAIYAAWRVRGLAGALVGGLAFIIPGLVLIVALAALFLGSPPDWIRGARRRRGSCGGCRRGPRRASCSSGRHGPASRRRSAGGSSLTLCSAPHPRRRSGRGSSPCSSRAGSWRSAGAGSPAARSRFRRSRRSRSSPRAAARSRRSPGWRSRSARCRTAVAS